jgi:hypothetical protein
LPLLLNNPREITLPPLNNKKLAKPPESDYYSACNYGRIRYQPFRKRRLAASMLKKLAPFLPAFIPVGFLFLLLSFFYVSMTSYIQCGSNNCTSLIDNLRKVYLTEEPNTSDAQTKENAETKKQEEFKNQELTALRFSGRAMFIFLANLYFLVCLIAAGFSLYIIYNSLKESVFFAWKKDVLYAAAITLAVAACTLLAAVLLYKNSDLYLTVFQFLLERGITKDLPQAEWLLRFVNSFGFAVCVMLYLTTTAVLFSPIKRSNPEGLVEASQKMKYLRTILYLGTLILVIGMLLIRAVHQWALAYMPRSEAAIKTAETFFSNLLAMDGGFFTMLLAAAYLPSAFIVRWQAEQINNLPTADTDKEKELQKYHLTFSFTESLPKIIAILGPILAGPIGELFTKLIK